MKIPKLLKIALPAGIISGMVFLIVFHTTLGLIFNLATGTLPNSKNISRMRTALLEQQSFTALLRRHETESDATSSVSRKRVSVDEWKEKTIRMVRNGT